MPDLTVETGVHALELAKTAWNAYLSGAGEVGEAREKVNPAKWFLELARGILQEVYGTEGDEDGPLTEVSALDAVISGDEE